MPRLKIKLFNFKLFNFKLFNFKQVSSILFVMFFALFLSACAGTPPADLGVTEDMELRACPSTPNCLQTYDRMDSDHFATPLSVQSNLLETKKAIKSVISETGGRIISEQTLSSKGYYLHAEYESNWLKFVDDVEVIVQENVIHFRSASRLGHSDFGVNKKRFEDIKALYHGASTPND